MIDTVRLRVNKFKNERFYQFCLECSSSRANGFIVENRHKITEREHSYIFKEIEYENTNYQIINGKFYNPSSTYNTSYQIKEEYILFELSLPKFMYGTNSLQLVNHRNPNKSNAYELFKEAVKHFFDTVFLGQRIDYSQVVLERFDVCFNQYFSSYKESFQALEYMKLKINKKYGSKDFATGLITLSKSSYMKIYHKGHEFIKKDSKHFKDTTTGRKRNRINGDDNHKKIMDLSSACLRFENQYKTSNWSYDYMTQFSNYKPYFKAYKGMMKDFETLSYEQRKHFQHLKTVFKDTRVKFVLAPSELTTEFRNVFLLKEDFFNHLVQKYFTYIQKQYHLGQNSTDQLTKSIYTKKKEDKNKTVNVRILTIIKCFGSLERARELEALSDRTYWRYVAYLKEKNLSTTKVKINIQQDWTYATYLLRLNQLEINTLEFNKSLVF